MINGVNTQLDGFHTVEAIWPAWPSIGSKVLERTLDSARTMAAMVTDSGLALPQALPDPRGVGGAARDRSVGLIGVALAAGEPGLMLEGAKRFGLDILLIIVGGVPVVLLKQALVHRRAPMV